MTGNWFEAEYPYPHPRLEVSFCASKILTLFRTEMSLAFDALDGEKRASITAFLGGEDHFFFIRSCDVRIPALFAGEAISPRVDSERKIDGEFIIPLEVEGTHTAGEPNQVSRLRFT